MPTRNPAQEKAWDELSSILTELSFLNARFDESLKLARDIGANVSLQGQVPYSEYEQLNERLQSWLDASRGKYPAYWSELARSALEMSEALVEYAYEGDEGLLAAADVAHAHLNASLDEHCDRPEYSIVEYCR